MVTTLDLVCPPSLAGGGQAELGFLDPTTEAGVQRGSAVPPQNPPTEAESPGACVSRAF